MLCSELEDVEVVNLPLCDVQLNDSIVSKMSFQHRRCDILGIDVRWIVDVPRWMLTRPVAWMSCTKVVQGDVLRALVQPGLLLRLSADVLSVRM